jgi:uncharacterized phage infection (PIP) family protein YhgE
LRLLSFNSIIEASRFGNKAQAVLAIARTIKEISAEWSQITDRSGQAMEEIEALVTQTNQAMDAFSDASNERLRDAQLQTRASLENLRATAAFAAGQSREMESLTAKMQTKSAEMSGADGMLGACSSRMDAILGDCQSVRGDMEAEQPDVVCGYDTDEAEQMFSVSYTTEVEREVLRAALRGGSLPVVAEHTVAGNSVELF